MFYELDLNMIYRNRYYPDRSGCRSLSGDDTGHNYKGEQYSPSAATTDESWIKGKKRYILIRLVHCTALGCGIGGLARSRSGIAPVSTVPFIYLICFLMSLVMVGMFPLVATHSYFSQLWVFAK
jgi:uncharacterized membrane protein YtjA (UPF0391 family)